jgi:hypothetical protein
VLLWVVGGVFLVCFSFLFVLFMIRDEVVEDFWPILMWFGFINSKGYGSVNPEGSGY